MMVRFESLILVLIQILARKYYLMACEVCPTVTAWLGVGKCSLRLGQLREAEDALAEAMPALEAAKLALQDLDKSDVTEVRYDHVTLDCYRCKLFVLFG